MESAASFGIAADFLSAFDLSGNFQVIPDTVLEVVRIYEVFASVVRRIDRSEERRVGKECRL